MTRPSRWLLAALLTLTLSTLWPAPEAWASELPEVLEAHNRERLALNTNGMMVLLGWSALNLTTGTAGWLLAKDERWRAFHQMNAMWNTVNAAIGVFGYLSNRGADPASFGLAATLQESYGMERLLAINVGLDVGYVALGAYLWERGLRKESARMRGWGQSVIAQGAFLFAFDVALLAMNASLDRDLTLQLQHLAPGEAALGVLWSF